MIRQHKQASFLRNEWRSAYRNARIVARFERDMLGGELSSFRVVEDDSYQAQAYRVQLGNRFDRLRHPIGHACRWINGPMDRLPQ